MLGKLLARVAQGAEWLAKKKARGDAVRNAIVCIIRNLIYSLR